MEGWKEEEKKVEGSGLAQSDRKWEWRVKQEERVGNRRRSNKGQKSRRNPQ